MSWDVIVVGGAGRQAQAMLQAAARGAGIGRWLAVDLAWSAQARTASEALGVAVETRDALADPAALRELVAAAGLVANFAGPYYRTGGVILDACIDARTDYLDICDDADATLLLLDRHAAAAAAGVRALIGMGSSPGITNVLVRLAVDALGSAEDVELAWIVDATDLTPASMRHFWHIFAPVSPDGSRDTVPSWESLPRRVVAFPDPIGPQTVFALAHPEPLTIPRYLPVTRARNFGGLVPEGEAVLGWALARLGAASEASVTIGDTASPASSVAEALYAAHAAAGPPRPFLGSGLVVDVHSGGTGLRFSSGDMTHMDEATGTPAAAAILALRGGACLAPGVSAPECLEPAELLPWIGKVSVGRGSLLVHRLEDGMIGERLRLRDLAAMKGGLR
jgi:saccharopine dehydrogenase-like NADP-dependent oxidoreductase